MLLAIHTYTTHQPQAGIAGACFIAVLMLIMVGIPLAMRLRDIRNEKEDR
jgi:hypothetical protein